MRLPNVEHGHEQAQKAMLEKMQQMRKDPVPDVLRVMLYRPELFGRAISKAFEEALRGNSAWSIGERELFAAFVSSKNVCAF